MKIIISSRRQVYERIETYRFKLPVVISILDVHNLSGNQKPIKTDSPVLTLRFSDATPKGRLGCKLKLFTLKEANKIIDFINNRPDKCRCIIIHCARGVSRSAAIAAGLLYGFYGVGGYALEPPFNPNKHVLKIIYHAIDKHIAGVNK